MQIKEKRVTEMTTEILRILSSRRLLLLQNRMRQRDHIDWGNNKGSSTKDLILITNRKKNGQIRHTNNMRRN